MQHKTIGLILCGIMLVMTACTPQSSPTLTPTSPPPTPTTLPPTANLSAFKPDAIREIDPWFSQMGKDRLLSGAVLLAHKGDVLLSQGYGLADREQNIPNTAQTRYRIASITKQFTAMAILILQAQGKLDVQDPICEYIPECPAAWEAITIDHLLTHTSGIPDYIEMNEYLSRRATPSTPEQIIVLFKDLPLDFQPGENWSYTDSGYVILGSIIEQVSGQSYETFLQQSIFTPLNMGDTGYDHNSNGVSVGYRDKYSTLPVEFYEGYAGGGLYSTVEDLYKWDQALYTEQLLPQAQLKQMFVSHAAIPDSGGWAYGYGWLIGEERGRTLIAHTGGIEGFASIIARYPDDQITIIILINQEDQDPILIQQNTAKKIFGEE